MNDEKNLKGAGPLIIEPGLKDNDTTVNYLPLCFQDKFMNLIILF